MTDVKRDGLEFTLTEQGIPIEGWGTLQENDDVKSGVITLLVPDESSDTVAVNIGVYVSSWRKNLDISYVPRHGHSDSSTTRYIIPDENRDFIRRRTGVDETRSWEGFSGGGDRLEILPRVLEFMRTKDTTISNTPLIRNAVVDAIKEIFQTHMEATNTLSQEDTLLPPPP